MAETLSNTESFSYGWLTSSKKSSHIDCDSTSLHQTVDGYDFDFGLTSSNSVVLVHADKIFSNGLLLPLYHVTPPSSSSENESEISKSSDSVLWRSLSLDSYSESVHSQGNELRPRSSCDNAVQSRMSPSEYSSLIFHSVPSTPISKSSSTKLKLPFLRNCARKYLCFLLPLCKKVKRLSSTSPRVPAMRTAPKRGVEWCRGNTTFDVREESSIYEAVLHCKKSVVCPVKDA